jgi:hydroxymethylglutaryl-CoA synthase
MLSCVFHRYEKIAGKPFTLSEASYVVCHAPYNKVLSRL